ncbi:pogo transposable protein [Rutstroemia sp. NJR-2017a WRK4]|nr:pogo transposable protein [Rutstroemia sp. NJR-2017a WRK4]
MDRISHEARIQSALADLDKQDPPNYSKAARDYGLSRSAISYRYRGLTTSRKEATSIYRQQLTLEQEQALISQINKLSARSIAPTSRIVRNLTEEIIDSIIGKNWTADFVKHYKDVLQSRYLRNIDNLHVKADSIQHFQYFYDLLTAAVEKYDIKPRNTYNWDEKGFLIGIRRSIKRIMIYSSYDQGKATKAQQDGSREFITLLASICTDGTALPPILIYQGASGDLQDSWVKDVEMDFIYHFGASANG